MPKFHLIEKQIILKKDKYIIWSNNKFYKGHELIKNINYFREKIKINKIKKGSLISFQDEFNFDSIAFFLASVLEHLIVIPLPENQKNLLSIVPCNFFMDMKQKKIIKIKNNKYKVDILRKFQKKNCSGLIVFSSGSSGKPKAILHDFNLLINKFKKQRPGYKTILMLTFDHLGGINTLLGSIFYKNGIAICTRKRNPFTVSKIIEKTKAELLPTTPTFLNILLLSNIQKTRDLSSLKLITFGAEFMPTELIKKLKKQFKNIKFKQTYGLSEIGVMRTKAKNSNSLAIKVGGEDYKIKVIDNILHIKSRTNMVGYLNAPQPFDKKGWINTEDKVVDEGEGYLRILGRESEIINVGGEKVYPQEIENTLLKCKGVDDSRVYKNRHEMLGEYIIAEVIFNKKLDNKFKSSEYLRKFCEKKLPKYKIPSKFIIKSMKDIVTNRLKKVRNFT